jgi:hypothetical protein
MEFVSWDDDIPNRWKFIKFHGSKPPRRFYDGVPFYCAKTTAFLQALPPKKNWSGVLKSGSRYVGFIGLP